MANPVYIFNNKTADKYWNKLLKIAKKGDFGVVEFNTEISNTIDSGGLSFLLDLFSKKKLTKVNYKASMDVMLKEMYTLVKSDLKDSESVTLKKYLDSRNLYQLGQDIYNSSDVKLGAILVTDDRDYISPPYLDSYLFDLYHRDKVSSLRVIKSNNVVTDITSITMSYIDKYKTAINILNS
jgi:hypothetical protein